MELEQNRLELPPVGTKTPLGLVPEVGHEVGDLVHEHTGQAGPRGVAPRPVEAKPAPLAPGGVGGCSSLELVGDHSGADLDHVWPVWARRVRRTVVRRPHAVADAHGNGNTDSLG